MLIVLVAFIIMGGATYQACRQAALAGSNARYVGMMNVASEKIAKTVRGMEMNAMNEFDEVEKHLDSPEAVIEALKSKVSLNPDVRGYFAAFEPNYFKEKGQWFEPYVHHVDDNDFEVRQVGSARHNYHKSEWYVRAKKDSTSFWSDPYYYYDGTSISGHYTTFVKPIYDEKGQLVCVCGADMTFEWLSKELSNIEEQLRDNDLLNRYLNSEADDFFAIVVNRDGSRIAGPDGKVVTMTEPELVRDFEQDKAGTVDRTVNGVPSTVYYGPIEYVNWTVAIVASKQNIQKPLLNLAIVLLLVSIFGFTAVWLVCRRLKDAEAD